MATSKKIKISDSANKSIPCVFCNPKKYLKFSLSFIVFESSSVKNDDIIKLWERLKWISSKPYAEMIYEYGRHKQKWFEKVSINSIRKRIPSDFRELFPSETNEKYDVLRVYPSGVPNGTANPRIIGMIKHSVFYIFFLDWDGKLYNH